MTDTQTDDLVLACHERGIYSRLDLSLALASENHAAAVRAGFVIRHAIGEPCGAWMGGTYICGCAAPVHGPRNQCLTCHHDLTVAPR